MPSIIIVEDDPMISEIYQKKFVAGGFEVQVATSGDQALELIKAKSPDILLLDLMMPKMNGYEVIENIRKGEYDQKVRIIVSSNLSQPEDREKALKIGANGFVSKSEFPPSKMVAEVTRLYDQFNEQGKNAERYAGNHKEGVAPAKDAPKKGKILLIEDEEIFIEMFGNKLKQEGYTVDFARNGAWGVKQAIKEKYDLFVIDMVMPAMTGEEMVNRIRLEEKVRGVPIIMLSASVDESDTKTVKELGVQGFLKKTQTTPTDLVKKVDEVLEK